MKSISLRASLALAAFLSLAPGLCDAQLVRMSTGANAAAIQTAVDTFRTDLGSLNPNVAGSFGAGRREINWDGVPAASSAPNLIAANFFNTTSPRGVIFSTPGSGFQVSAAVGDPSGAPINFGNIDPSYSGTFAQFSAQRIFTSLGSNITDINFFLPGTTTPALTTGFGAVFTDVDIANTTSIQLFNSANVSLGTFFVPATSGSATLSFLGISFPTAIISRVRITAGNTALGAGVTDQNGVTRDLVAMDDFIFGEPVPEPATVLFLVMGALLLIAAIRRRRSA